MQARNQDNARVMVLDDHDDVRDMLCALVRRWGYECRAVSNRDEALTLLPIWKPALIIFEPSLRDGSGPGMSHRFRQWADHAQRTLRIIMYTYARRPDAGALDLVDDCLLKPADAGVIHAALQHALPMPN